MVEAREIGALAVGGVGGSVVHQVMESFFDDYYATASPDTYLVKSTVTTSVVLGVIGAALFFFSMRGTVGRGIGAIGAGIALAEIPQLIDMVRVSAGLGRTA
jgi:hypothetical protein